MHSPISVAYLNAGCYLQAFPAWAALRLALNPRQTVAIATGILMVRHDCSSDEALALLSRLATEQQVSPHEMATLIVQSIN